MLTLLSLVVFSSNVLAKPVTSSLMMLEPTPRPISIISAIEFTSKPITSLRKPTPSPVPVEWKGNGTTDGLCSENTYDSSVEQGKQRWLFVLTSPYQTASWTLEAKFEPNTSVEIKEVRKNANGSVHFIVYTAVGAELKGATATGGTANSVLTVSHCEYNVSPLEVTKTAETSYTRTWEWSIDKSADKTDLGELQPGDTEAVNYTVKVSAEPKDSDWKVSGNITITNPEDNGIPAEITEISDYLDKSSGNVEIDCEESLPYELPAGGTLNCTYTKSVSDTSDTLNTVEVKTEGLVPGNKATAKVEWGEPEKIHECVNVKDDKYSQLDEEVCASDLVSNKKVWEYGMIFAKSGGDVELECGEHDYTNKVTYVATDDEEYTNYASWTVKANLMCELACGYTQGYWFAKPDITWPSDVTLGEKNYNRTEGINIWNTSNAGGKTDAKKGFLQYSALMLSIAKMGGSVPSEIADDLEVIDSFFSDYGFKYDGTNISDKNKDVSNAADSISNWLNANHCEDDDLTY